MGLKEKTLNRYVFTILKRCFPDPSIPFPLNPCRTLQPICEALEFWGKRLEGICLVHLLIFDSKVIWKLMITG